MSDSQKTNKSTTANDTNVSTTPNDENPSIVVANFTSVGSATATATTNNTNREVKSKEPNEAPPPTTVEDTATQQNSTSENPSDPPVGQSQQQPSSYHLPYPNAHVQHPYPTPNPPPRGHMPMAYSQPPPMTYHQMPPLSGTGSARGGINPNGRPGSSPSGGGAGEYGHRLPPPPLPMNGGPPSVGAAVAAGGGGGAHYHHPHHHHPATAAAAAGSHLHPHAIPPQATWQAYPIATDISVPSSSKAKSKSKQLTTPPEKFLNLTDEQVSTLISDSTLVTMQDRKFVPDYLFISIGQLEISHLTNEDQIGVYRNRTIGQIGLCCRHCKGSPGNGRYFPETVRSLGQSTTSATIAKHMSEKCPMIPIEIKDTVKQLKYEQDWMDQLVKKKVTDRYESRPKYGSRKLFFNNVWKRLTGEDTDVTK